MNELFTNTTYIGTCLAAGAEKPSKNLSKDLPKICQKNFLKNGQKICQKILL